MDQAPRQQAKLFLLDQIPLFAGLSKRNKALIARSGVIEEVKRGAILYDEGSPASAFYCLVTGRVRLYIARRGVKEDLEYLHRGKYFGILSLLTGEPHSVSAQAVNDSIVLKIPKDDFAKVLKNIPELAVHFGQTLSRRLKKKDMREKRVFESTIISTFGSSEKVGASKYALSLATGLKNETNKKVILFIIDPKSELRLETPFFSEDAVRRHIKEAAAGVMTLAVNAGSSGGPDMASLLSYLTNDYSYIVVDLPSRLDTASFNILKQSDMIHIITASDRANLALTRELVLDLRKGPGDIAQKIKVIIAEYGGMKPISHQERAAILTLEVYATLPVSETEYLKALRRISRDVGECLVGLALGSGAALALAHVGILKVMERENIPIDILAGTSMGALIGALWASGKTTTEIEGIVAGFRSKIRTLGLADLTFPTRGLIKGREIRRFLERHLNDATFYDLKMPFKAVACDIEKREEVVLEKGSLVDAVMASVSIPGVFEPVEIDGRLLVDGGIINPLPTNVLLRLGVSKIISVNTLPSPEDIQRSKKKVTNIFDIIVNAVQAGEYLLAEMSGQSADIAMHPILSTADWYEFYEGAKVIRRGEEEALSYLPRIKELVYSS